MKQVLRFGVALAILVSCGFVLTEGQVDYPALLFREEGTDVGRATKAVDCTGNTLACSASAGGVTVNSTAPTLTRISGSSGAAGPDETWQFLTSNCTANATTTLATCMTTTGVGAGTWQFKYVIVYQSDATTTGVDFAVKHVGIATTLAASSWFVTSGGTAANGLADQVSSNTANLVEGKSARAVTTKMGASLGVDTVNADMLYVIEGILQVVFSQNLELQHASEVSASSQVMNGTTLILRKLG